MILQPIASSSAGASLVPVQTCNLRLSLSSTDPAPSSDITAATSVYALPFQGNQIALHDGSDWQLASFTSASLSTTSLTAAKLHDVFGYLSGGTLALEALAWSNDTTRATAIATHDGIAVKSGDSTRRLLGTFYAFDDSGTTKTCDTAGGVSSGGTQARRFLCNLNNRLPRPCFVGDDSDSWTYGSNAWRAANNSSAMRVSFVQADSLYPAEAINAQNFAPSGNAIIGIGVDTTTAAASGVSSLWNGTSICQTVAAWRGHLAPGLHYLAALEFMMTGSATFYGDLGGWPIQSGLLATVWC
jgi:hypothetical protein